MSYYELLVSLVDNPSPLGAEPTCCRSNEMLLVSAQLSQALALLSDLVDLIAHYG